MFTVCLLHNYLLSSLFFLFLCFSVIFFSLCFSEIFVYIVPSNVIANTLCNLLINISWKLLAIGCYLWCLVIGEATRSVHLLHSMLHQISMLQMIWKYVCTWTALKNKICIIHLKQTSSAYWRNPHLSILYENWFFHINSHLGPTFNKIPSFDAILFN